MIKSIPASTFSSTFRDYLALTKPRIVALLIFTTIAAMIVARPTVGLNIFLATVMGGSFAAAGASAINQYIDREIDAQMSRTKNRPIPGGRIRPVNALIFGLALIAWSTFILLVMVNEMAALLALIGAAYYVLLYTLILKRNTALNIIIGGGAGAMPVLVGWAAATGGLSFQAYLLFAIIFFWTPPHSWALAVLVNADYERVDIPMLPVAHGAEFTRLQIVWYSLQLVILTLLPFPLGMLGMFYLGAALLLGAGLMWKSFVLLQAATKLTARQMYKYSSLYLALLFLAMIIDKVFF
ncbi:MAG: heme o synthase [Chloroflexota bacterium]